MNRLYLGQPLDYRVRAPQVYRKPIAVSWRYQMKGLDCTPTPVETPARSINPEAVNWRYQVPGM